MVLVQELHRLAEMPEPQRKGGRFRRAGRKG
jgi:hypothetical protein